MLSALVWPGMGYRASTLRDRPFSSMRILVTGHLGYIGSVLTQALILKGHALTGMDRRSEAGCASPVPMLEGDIRDIAPDALRGFEAVIHLAALPADSEDQLDPQTSLEVNHLAAARLAVLAKVAGVGRFLFASASPEQRGGTSGYPMLEQRERSPVPFDVAKGRAEIDLARLNSEEFRVVTLRLPSVYGRSPRMRSDLVLHALVDEAQTQGALGFNANANDLNQPIHINDVVRGFEQALVLPAEELTHAVYDLGASIAPVQRSELLRMVAERVEGTEVHVIPSIPPAVAPQPRAPRAQPQGLPGFEAEISLDQGLEGLLSLE